MTCRAASRGLRRPRAESAARRLVDGEASGSLRVRVGCTNVMTRESITGGAAAAA